MAPAHIDSIRSDVGVRSIRTDKDITVREARRVGRPEIKAFKRDSSKQEGRGRG